MSSEPGNPRTQPEKIALLEIVEAEGVRAGKRFPPSLRNHFEGIKAANNFEEIVGRSPADRLGILGPPGTAGMTWGNFANFLRYNAQVNSFMPAAIRPILGVAATVLESLLGISLFLGVCTPLAAAGA